MSDDAEHQASDFDSAAIDHAADIVAAYVSHNTISPSELPGLIKSVHASIAGVSTAQPEAPAQEPAVAVRSSIKPDSIACLECGKRFKALKRHLNTAHDLTPASYRAKWNLREDYPIVARNYAAQRSDLAKKLGLGRKAA